MRRFAINGASQLTRYRFVTKTNNTFEGNKKCATHTNINWNFPANISIFLFRYGVTAVTHLPVLPYFIALVFVPLFLLFPIVPQVLACIWTCAEPDKFYERECHLSAHHVYIFGVKGGRAINRIIYTKLMLSLPLPLCHATLQWVGGSLSRHRTAQCSVDRQARRRG